MDDFERLKAENFVLACNDMLSGRFLDISKKIEEVMNTLVDSDAIISYLADVIDDYDAEAGLASAFLIDPKTKKVKVALPNNENERVALTVQIFNDIQNKKLNATQFLETYFRMGNLTPTQNFLELIIKPFRNAICKNFDIDENLTQADYNEHFKESKMQEELTKQAELENMFPKLDDFCEEVVKICGSVVSALKFEKKNEEAVADAEFILSSIIHACELKDLQLINGLILGLDYATKKVKSVKYLVRDLNKCTLKYYDFLAEQKNQKSAD